jgi:hypothetical protein
VINLVVSKGAQTPTRLRVEYGSYNTGKVSLRHGALTDRGLDLLLSGSVWRSDGYRYDAPAGEDLPVRLEETGGIARASDGVMRINGYGPSYDLFAKLSLGNFTLRANAMASDFTLSRGQKGSLLDYRGEGQSKFQQPVLGNPEQFRPFRRDGRQFAELEYNQDGIFNGTLSVKVFGDHFSEEQRGINMSRHLAPPEGWVVFFGGENYRLGAEAHFNTQLRDWLTLRVGVTGESTHATDSYVDDNRKGTLGDEHPGRVDLVYAGLLATEGYDTFGGAFTTVTAQALPSLSLTAGGRLDYHRVYKYQMSPRFAIVWQPFATVFAKALYGEAYEAPPYLYRTGNASSGYQGQPSLRPQYMKTAELVVGLQPSDRLYLDVNGFYNRLTNFIKADFDVSPYSFRNQGELTLMGVESTIKLALLEGRMNVMVNGHYNHPVVERTSANFLQKGSLISVPRMTANAVATAKPMDALRISLGANFHGPVESPIRNPLANDAAAYAGAGAQKAYDPNHRIGAALTVNGSAMYRIRAFVLGVTAHNLLDTADYAGGSVPVPYRLEGRRLMGSISYQLD